MAGWLPQPAGTAVVTADERRSAAWLQARGWRQTLAGQWAHDHLGYRNGVAAAVQAQTRHEHAQACADRDRDMAAVATNAGDEWMNAALEAVRGTACCRTEFTTDHVLDDHPDLPEPHDGRAWGPVMVRAKSEGIVVSTERMAPSSRRSSNARRKLLWRSLILTRMRAEAVAHG